MLAMLAHGIFWLLALSYCDAEIEETITQSRHKMGLRGANGNPRSVF
jgi:hypothetical protein